MLLLLFFEGAENDAGQLTLEILRETDTLWFFLDQAGVEPINNPDERALRCALQWHKCSNGTQSEKGNRWVEWLLSFRQACLVNIHPSTLRKRMRKLGIPFGRKAKGGLRTEEKP